MNKEEEKIDSQEQDVDMQNAQTQQETQGRQDAQDGQEDEAREEPQDKKGKSRRQMRAECRQQKADEMAKLQAEVADAKDQYVRLAAEFDNYRRRTAKERLELIDSASKDVLTGFLPVLDDCQRALQVLKESDAAQSAIEGTELILNKLTAFLNSRGVQRIDAKGKPFDTDFHEAVAQFPVQDESQKNMVIDIAQEGYTLNGNVIRFAKVVVGI